jgi:hypothetical protein
MARRAERASAIFVMRAPSPPAEVLAKPTDEEG